MKCAVFLAILAFAFIANSDGIEITTWGTTANNNLRNETIVVQPQPGLILNRNFTFTVVSYWNSIEKIYSIFGLRIHSLISDFLLFYLDGFQNGPIRGLRHVDWQSSYRRVRARIVEGGLGHNTVTVNLESQRSYGFNSSLNFFG